MLKYLVCESAQLHKVSNVPFPLIFNLLILPESTS